MGLDKADGKRKAILPGAGECFAKFGFVKTTLEDIARRGDLNKATLYYYLNKESIFTQVVLRESEKFIASLQARIAGEPGIENRITFYLTERLDYHRRVVKLHELSVQFLREVEPVFDGLYRLVFEREVDFVAQILREGEQQGYFVLSDAHRVALSLLTIADAIKFKAVQQANVERATQIDYPRIKEEIAFVAGLILRGIRTNPARV